jgi:hypothetical protein
MQVHSGVIAECYEHKSIANAALKIVDAGQPTLAPVAVQ